MTLLKLARTIYHLPYLIFLSNLSCKSRGSQESSPFVSEAIADDTICEDLSYQRITVAPDRTRLDQELARVEGQEIADFAEAARRYTANILNDKPEYHISLQPLEAGVLYFYTDSLYDKLNPALYAKNCRAFPYTAQTMASGLNKVAAMRGIFYRGGSIKEEELADYAVGKVTVARAFLSASGKKDVADRFARNALFEISTEGVGLIDWLSAHNDEEEVLFPPGARFDVLSVTRETRPNPTPSQDTTVFRIRLRHQQKSLSPLSYEHDLPLLRPWQRDFDEPRVGEAMAAMIRLLPKGHFIGNASGLDCHAEIAVQGDESLTITLSSGNETTRVIHFVVKPQTVPRNNGTMTMRQTMIEFKAGRTIPSLGLTSFQTFRDAQGKENEAWDAAELTLDSKLRWRGFRTKNRTSRECVFNAPQLLQW